jgi:hypothetical protein
MKVVQSTVSNAREGIALNVVNAKTNVVIRVNKYSSKTSGARIAITRTIIFAHRWSCHFISVIIPKTVISRNSAIIAMQEIRQRTSHGTQSPVS